MGTRLPKLDKAFPVGRDSDGNKLCRWCKGTIPKGRRTLCSDGCVHELLMRTNPNYLRRLVFTRDKGVCMECGCDTEKVSRVARHAATSYREIVRNLACGRSVSFHDWHYQAIWKVFAAQGFNWGQVSALWEADHVVEVVRSGDSCLENMQTLCIPCHKRKTKQLAGERAKERRDKKRGLLAA